MEEIQRQIAELERRNAELSARNEELGLRVKRLEEAAVPDERAPVIEIQENDAKASSTSIEASGEEVAAKADADGYALSASVWHASVLYGSPAVGCGGTCFLILLLVINILSISLFFVVLCAAPGQFLDDKLPESSAMLTFRQGTAHDLARANVLMGQSLAARICADDDSLPEGDGMRDLLKMESAYNAKLLGIPTGTIMSSLCIFIWYMNVAPDLTDSATFIRAMWMVPKGSRTRISDSQGGEALKLETLGRLHFGAIVVIGVLRFVSTVGFAIIGSLWLAQTGLLMDMVLNAGALTCVKLDELLFNVFAPIPTRKAMSVLEPVRMPRQKLYHGVGPRAVGLLLGVMILLAAMIQARITPLSSDLAQSRENLCGGDVNFVVAADAVGSVIWAPTNAIGGEEKIDLAIAAVQSLVKRAGWENSPPSCNKTDAAVPAGGFCGKPDGSAIGFEMVLAEANLPLNSLSMSHGVTCVDDPLDTKEVPRHWTIRLGRQVGWYDASMPGGTNLTENTTCESLKHFCNRHGVPLMRMSCPITCGCDDPESGLVFTDGCPQSCVMMEDYVKFRKERECTDYDLNELRNLKNWAAIVDGFNEVGSLLADPQKHGNALNSSDSNTTGCDYVERWSELFCSDGLVYKSMAMLCPMACQCNSHQHEGLCPNSCALKEHAHR